MSITLSIPIKQQITLPDAWQACRTPQELSYWLIAKFETFADDVQNAVELAGQAGNDAATALATAQQAAADAASALSTISNLDAQVVQLNARVTSLAADITAAEGDITALAARVTTAEGDIDSLEDRVSQNEFDIGQNAGNISAIGTDIGTDTTAGTIKGRITALEGKKLYLHRLYISLTIPNLGSANVLKNYVLRTPLNIYKYSQTPISTAEEIKTRWMDGSYGGIFAEMPLCMEFNNNKYCGYFILETSPKENQLGFTYYVIDITNGTYHTYSNSVVPSTIIDNMNEVTT